MINKELNNNSVQVRRKVHKKLVVDDHGMPTEVIIPWDEYQEIEELLGLDFDDTAFEALKQAKKDRESGNKGAFIDLDLISEDHVGSRGDVYK
jgi:PHD/YefM family antitoxin component YafN of YafNO toxin-antitoxin module